MKTQQKVEYVSINKVQPDEGQPRKNFDVAALERLTKSIAKWGIKNPIKVTELPGGHYSIIDGERRLKAAHKAGLREVPIMNEGVLTAIERLTLQFHLQGQHENWSSTETANAVIKAADELNMPLKELCVELGLETKAASRYLALAALREKVLFERTEVPLEYASRIHTLKVSAQRSYMAKHDEKFDINIEKKLERAVITRYALGIITKRADFTKLADSFRKSPDSIMSFIEDTKSTPDSLFTKTKARGAYALRNVSGNAVYLYKNINKFLIHKDVLPSAGDIQNVKQARAACDKFLKAVE